MQQLFNVLRATREEHVSVISDDCCCHDNVKDEGWFSKCWSNSSEHDSEDV